MSKATAGVEIPELAEKHGFHRTVSTANRVGYVHPQRREAFLLDTEEGAFISATWHAPQVWKTVVDKRAPGERANDGGHLVGNNKRRHVGLSDVYPKAVTAPHGLIVGYLDIKRRIKDPDWKEKAS